MTKTCFRGGCSKFKAYAGASVAEYGTIGGASERSQVVLRTPKLDLGVGPAPSDLRLPGGRGRRKRQSPNTSASAGQRHIFLGNHRVLRTCSRECRTYVFIALGIAKHTFRAADAPRSSFDSATVEPKHSGHTRACHKAIAQGLAKPGFARRVFLFRSMTRCISVVPGLVRVRVALMSLRCLAIFSCGLHAFCVYDLAEYP